MARGWSCGFEFGDGAKECAIFQGAAATVQSTTKRTGTYALKILTPSSATPAGIQNSHHSFSNPATFFGRFYLYVQAAPNATTTIFRFAANATTLTSGTTWGAAIQLDTNGDLLILVEGGTSLGTVTLNTGAWYRVELKCTPGNASGSDVIEMRLDGVEQINRSNLTITIAPNSIELGVNLSGETATSGEWYFDDVCTNDATGTAQNTWPGDGSIIHLHPNAAGDFAEGTFGGGSGNATAYLNVDEVTPNDATDYWVLADPSTGATDADRLDVNCEAFSPTGQNITVVQLGIYARPAATGAAQVIARIKSQASGTIIEGSTQQFSDNVDLGWYAHNSAGAGRRVYLFTSYTDPQTGGAWTDVLLGTMQIGARASDATPDAWISKMWALVEYAPGAVTAFRQSLLGVGM